MNLEAFRQFSDTNDWSLIIPEVSIASLALALLVLEVILPRDAKRMIPRVAVLGQVLVLGLCVVNFLDLPDVFNQSSFAGMLMQTRLTVVMQIFFLISSLLVTYLGSVFLAKQSLPRTEFYHIILVVTLGFMLLVQSNHFVMLFVALETVTIGFYILVSYLRSRSTSLEAGLKYLILGALSSSILLFGIVLLYGLAGNAELAASTPEGMGFIQLGSFIAANTDNPLVQGAVVLVLAGVAFKIGAVPFQIWIPDVYQGAPTPSASFLAVASKAAGFIVLINLLRGPFLSMQENLLPLLSSITVITILFGNVAALTQRNVKRMMGLSGVAHAGYLLAGVTAFYAGSAWAIPAIVFYLFTYLLGSFSVFGVMTHLATENDERQTLEDYANLGKQHPFLATVLSIGLGSLAGIPPLAGFIGKFVLFLAIYDAGLYTLLAISIIGVVISIYYYFGWVREALFSTLAVENPGPAVSLSFVQKAVLTLLCIGTVILGLYQGYIGTLILPG